MLFTTTGPSLSDWTALIEKTGGNVSGDDDELKIRFRQGAHAPVNTVWNRVVLLNPSALIDGGNGLPSSRVMRSEAELSATNCPKNGA
jgi:hypothetical protein